MKRAICPECKSDEVQTNGSFQTCVGFLSPPGHDHNNNCNITEFSCRDCDYAWKHAKRRRCPHPDCDFVTKETCFCFEGKAVFGEVPEAKYIKGLP